MTSPFIPFSKRATRFSSAHPAFTPRRAHFSASPIVVTPKAPPTNLSLRPFLAQVEHMAKQVRPPEIQPVPLGLRPPYHPGRNGAFRYSGKQFDTFDDARVPYEIARAQVIPYYTDPEGDRVYYAGVDAKAKEVAGFGGYIEGRPNSHGQRAGYAYMQNKPLGNGEDIAIAAIREFTEESMNVFTDTYKLYDFFKSPFVVVEDTVFVFLSVGIAPKEAEAKFEQAISQHHQMTSNAFRETLTIVPASSREMELLSMGKRDSIGGYPVWNRYQHFIERIATDYEYVF